MNATSGYDLTSTQMLYEAAGYGLICVMALFLLAWAACAVSGR